MNERRFSIVFRSSAVLLILFGVSFFSDSAAFAADQQSVAQIEAAAEKEGTVVWYAGMRSDDADRLAAEFMKDYPGVKVDVVHMTSTEIATRTMMEQRGKKYNADYLSASSYATSQLKAEGLLESFVLPAEMLAPLAKGSYDPDGYWISQYALTYPITYNPEKLSAEGLKPPTSLEDFTKPEWKGKFAVATAHYDWYQGLNQYLGREKARALAEQMAANMPLIRSNSGVLLELIEAGGFAATPQIFGYSAYEQEKKGEPIKVVNVTPVVTTLQTGGIALNSPHANAAKLFQFWWASKESQQFIASTLGRTSTRTDVNNIQEIRDPTKADFPILDPDMQAKTAHEFQAEYDSIFGIGGAKKLSPPKL